MIRVNLKNIYKNKSYKFLLFGLLNLFITNLTIQFLLLFKKAIFATFIGQMINFSLGFYFYSSKVFEIRVFRLINLSKYTLLNLILWFLNWKTIELFHSYGFSKNIVALILIPFLALISYLAQKNIVFKK